MLRSFGNILWFTNIAMPQVEPLTLTKSYDIQKYPHYDNYQGIEVKRLKDIPGDYSDVMGVPITLMTQYNPEQFELLGYTARVDLFGLKIKRYTVEDSSEYNDLNAGPVVKTEHGLKRVYKRIMIKHKHIPNISYQKSGD